MSNLFKAIAITLTLVASFASADTAFTYQGSLTEAGQPAQGAYDLVVRLFGQETGGTELATANTIDDVPVTDGVFTIELDYGTNAFDNNARWLQIEVNGVVLDPRQRITPTPYAIQTRGIFVNDAGMIGIGTTNPQKEIDLEGTEPTIRLTATDPFPGMTSRLQFRGSAGPPVFHPFGTIEFLDATSLLRSQIRATAAGADASSLSFYVAPSLSSLPQMSINASGVKFENEIRPPIAYGKVGFDGTLISGSTNITNIQHFPPTTNSGAYGISFEEGLLETDIVLVTLQDKGLIEASVQPDGTVSVNTYSSTNANPSQNLDFSFVVYRP